MSKELEALRQLFEFSKSSASLSRSQSYEDLKILDEALKRKEKLEKFYNLAKNKLVDFGRFSYCNREEYNEKESDVDFMLTTDEFNLLKEMLEVE